MSAEREIFQCTLCHLQSPYDIKTDCSKLIPKNIKLLETVYCLKDPFSNERTPIFLGGDCCLCGAPVCMNQECSLFYKKRYCLPCAKKNLTLFPPEIQSECQKKV